MKLRTIFILCLLSAIAFAQGVKEPEAPVISDPESPVSNEETTKQEKAEATLPVTLVFASGDKLRGRIILHAGGFTIPARESVWGRDVVLPYSNILNINVLLWQAKEKRKDEFYFTPSLISITMKNGEVYRCAKMMERIDFIGLEGGRYVFFTSFFDYRIDGKWNYSGQSDKDYPSRNPLPQTVISIVFDSR